MKTQFVPPVCLIDTYKTIFPTLDFTRIDFFLDTDVDRAAHPGYHRPALGRSSIGLHPNDYDPCGHDTWSILLHELVHALQQQSQSYLVSRTTSLVCYLLHGTSPEAYQHGNCVEIEARDFVLHWDTALSLADLAITAQRKEAGTLPRHPDSRSPCQCSSPTNPWTAAITPLPDAEFSLAFELAIRRDPSLIKHTAGCPPTRCLEGNSLVQLAGRG